MEKYYWYSECSNCHQGRLILTEDKTNKRIYLHCEECERGWLSPEEVNDISKSFLCFEEDFETINPSFENIKGYGWGIVAKNFFIE